MTVSVNESPALTVLYDAACPLCRREISVYRGLRPPWTDTPVCYADKSLVAVIRAVQAIAHIDDPFTDKRHVVKANSAGTIVGMAVPRGAELALGQAFR